MKTIKLFKTIIGTFLLIFLFTFSLQIKAQSIPETFNYQAVARTDDGSPIANQEVIIEISILQGTNCEQGGCNVIWQEIHYPTTNEFGLFSIRIGNGQNTFVGSVSSFNAINWYDVSAGSYFLKMRVDFGSSEYANGMLNMGTTLFQSVPYSLVAENSEDVVRVGGKLPFELNELSNVNITNPSDNQILQWNGTNWENVTASSGNPIALNDLTDVTITTPTTSNVLYFDGTDWLNQQLNFTDLSGTFTLNDLSDVTITAAAINEVLTWDGSGWINQTASGGGSVWTLNGTDIYYNAGNVGIGTATPGQPLHVELAASEGVLFSGTFNNSINVASYGAGTRMVFFPCNASFRGGEVDGTQWDDANIGDYSFAFGLNTIASGHRTVAFGRNTTAQGVGSAVFGYGNTIYSASSLSAGTNNTLEVASDYSLVVGQNNILETHHAFIFGEGCLVSTNGINGFAGGFETEAAGYYSTALGERTEASTTHGFYIGRYNTTVGNEITWVATDPLFVAGNGTAPASLHDAMVLSKDGNLYLDATLHESAFKKTKNVKTIDNSLNNIMQINGIKYFNEGRNKNQFGFTAENVELVFPELVSNNSNGGKSISYTRFTPIIIEALKEQQLIINNLKQENKDLEQKYQDLLDRVEKLENN